MTDLLEEEKQNKNYSNQLRTNFIRTKKSGASQDKEHLYEENRELKNKIVELQELTTKMKTQLSIAEK